MSKPDVSTCSSCPLAKHAGANIIEIEFEDKIPENSDAVIKVKKISKFLGMDLTKYKIVGDNETKSHKSNISQHKLTFTLRDKKTKKVEQLVIDFLQQPNEKEFTGIVTSVVSEPTKSSGFILAPIGTKVVASENPVTEKPVRSLDNVVYVYGWPT